jgi:hypothetical protein
VANSGGNSSPPLAVKLVLGGIDGLGLLEDLARDPLVIDRPLAAGVRRELNPIDRHQPRPSQPRPRTEAEHRAEQLPQGPLVALDETSDRRVIGHLLGGDYAIGDVLASKRQCGHVWSGCSALIVHGDRGRGRRRGACLRTRFVRLDS